MDAITFTVTPRGSTQSLTIDLTALLSRLQTVPDQRKRRGVRYPLPVLLTVAVLAKLCGDSHVYAIADWAQARAAEVSKQVVQARRLDEHRPALERLDRFLS